MGTAYSEVTCPRGTGCSGVKCPRTTYSGVNGPSGHFTPRTVSSVTDPLESVAYGPLLQGLQLQLGDMTYLKWLGRGVM